MIDAKDIITRLTAAVYHQYFHLTQTGNGCLKFTKLMPQNVSMETETFEGWWGISILHNVHLMIMYAGEGRTNKETLGTVGFCGREGHEGGGEGMRWRGICRIFRIIP